jgi:hypothetical protein
MRDQRWQPRRCAGCGHVEEFPALMPTIAVCSGCWSRTEHERLCRCGCGAAFVPARRRDQLYVAASHKTRAWKDRANYDAARAAQRAATRLPGAA